MRKAKDLACYTHHGTPNEQKPDTAPGPYYVSVRDGDRYGLLLGPFEKHQEALDMVEPARAKAIELNGCAHFYSFGTCRMKCNFNKPGRLNEFFERTKSK